MQVEVQAVAPEQVEADVLAVPLAGGAGGEGALAQLDGPLDGLLTRLAGEGELREEIGRAAIVHVDGRLGARRVAGAGVGPRDRVDADALRTAAAAVVHAAGGFAKRIAWAIDESLPLSPAEQARARRRRDRARRLRRRRAGRRDDGAGEARPRSSSCGDDGRPRRGRGARGDDRRVGEPRARPRRTGPPNDLTPERLAERAQEIAARARAPHRRGARARRDPRSSGMGAFAAVAQGSHNPPRLIVLRYDPPERRDGDLVLGLVGKAITFDTGGISLKPALYMEDMKGDMAGGAAVIEGIGAIAELGPAAARPRRRRGDGEHAERRRLPTRRHPHGGERQDDRGHEHRRRGPARARRRALVRARAGRDAPRSTSRR